jgi:hypothetical protein
VRCRRAGGVQAQRRQAAQQPLDGGVSLQARQVHPEAHVRPVREGDLQARVLAAHVEAIGVAFFAYLATRVVAR